MSCGACFSGAVPLVSFRPACSSELQGLGRRGVGMAVLGREERLAVSSFGPQELLCTGQSLVQALQLGGGASESSSVCRAVARGSRGWGVAGRGPTAAVVWAPDCRAADWPPAGLGRPAWDSLQSLAGAGGRPGRRCAGLPAARLRPPGLSGAASGRRQSWSSCRWLPPHSLPSSAALQLMARSGHRFAL